MKKQNVKFNLRVLRKLKSVKKQKETTENVIVDKNTEFSTKEAYKTLRTNIMFSLKNDGKSKAVVVTSAIPSDGKTTTALNIASTFSQIGSKVILIDADLRKPKIHKYLEVDNNDGVSGILSGFAKTENTILKTKFGFDCITAGKVPPNPSELISSPVLANLIDELKESYDYIFIDSPPASIVSDALTISALSDGVLLVVRSKYTPKSLLNNAINSIKFTNSKIIGIVINGVEKSKSAYGVHKGKYYTRRKYGYSRYNYYNYYAGDHQSNK
ncbi:MAG: CpsD/CapB family tyrosine-protein kinase [Clostridia bacterium]|nr:CpsD/CapB family tyrosine-protein kinase [Clostridia bacterium]